MSQFGGVERPSSWETAGDHERRIRALEAVDPCSCLSPGMTLDQLILSNPCLVAFWKLNETSGDIAEDSGPGNFDMDSGAGSAPEWASTTTPFGELAPLFGTGDLLEDTGFPTLDADLTLEIWGMREEGSGGAMIGQGNPYPANNAGVSLAWIGEGTPTAYYARATIGDSSGGPHGIEVADFDPDANWHHFALTRESNLWTLYVDSDPVGTFDDGGTNYLADSGIQVGNISASLSAFMFRGYLSYAAAYDCALSGSDILLHFETGMGAEGAQDGWVVTADSTSSTGWSWQPPTIEVEF